MQSLLERHVSGTEVTCLLSPHFSPGHSVCVVSSFSLLLSLLPFVPLLCLPGGRKGVIPLFGDFSSKARDRGLMSALLSSSLKTLIPDLVSDCPKYFIFI